MRKLRSALLDDDDLSPEVPMEWFLPELDPAFRTRQPAEDLGLRRWFELPDEVAPRRGFGRRRASDFAQGRNGRGPDWPDAA